MPQPKNNQWRELYPFASSWLEIEGRRLHYVDEGPAGSTETLLFVHGNPTWSFHWRELLLAFRGRYRCVAIDHLGCGLSEMPSRPLRLADRVDHVVELVQRLGLDRITLVAQDWGGAIGLGALLRRTEKFQRIMLFNTGAFPPPLFPLRIRLCRLPLLGRLAVQGGGLFSRVALHMALNRQRLDPRVASAYLAPYHDWSSRQAIYDFVQDIPSSQRHPTWRTLENIEAGLSNLSHLPIGLCWGMRDWCFTPACLDRFRAHWPQADVAQIADAGHWVVEDAPQQARQSLENLLSLAIPGTESPLATPTGSEH